MNQQAQIEADRRPNGEFGEHERSAPGITLAEDSEILMWLIEGDDHEARVYQAPSEEAALEMAEEGFRQQYRDDEGDEDEDEDEDYEREVNVDLVAVFRASQQTEDSPEDWIYIPGEGSASSEEHALRVLDGAEY